MAIFAFLLYVKHIVSFKNKEILAILSVDMSFVKIIYRVGARH